ncbi:unnamed protein product, partial [Phaeothamnion confervicola]
GRSRSGRHNVAIAHALSGGSRAGIRGSAMIPAGEDPFRVAAVATAAATAGSRRDRFNSSGSGAKVVVFGVRDGLIGRSGSVLAWGERGHWETRPGTCTDAADHIAFRAGLEPLFADFNYHGVVYMVLFLGFMMASAVVVATLSPGSMSLAGLLAVAALNLLVLLWLRPFSNAAVNALWTLAAACNAAVAALLLAAARQPSSVDGFSYAATAVGLFGVVAVVMPCYLDFVAYVVGCCRHRRRGGSSPDNDDVAAVIAAAGARPDGSG